MTYVQKRELLEDATPNLEYRKMKEKKAQVRHKLHDLRLHLNIQEHDLNIKVRQAEKFLAHKDQVRVTLQLKGRERSRPDSGVELLNTVIERLADHGTPQKLPSRENLSFVLNPKK